jgi:hypothetical protein
VHKLRIQSSGHHVVRAEERGGKSLNRNDAGVWVINFQYWDENPSGTSTCTAPCRSAAEIFAAALNRLRASANDTSAPLRTIAQRAAAWRALPSKPPIPEEVRVQCLLTETAFREKQLGESLIHYEAGLELYPTWPQGRTNAANIAAKLAFYADAVEHMQA